MNTYPFGHARPVRVWDGEDCVESFDSVDFGTLWAIPKLNDNEKSLVVLSAEDVRIGDIVRLPYNQSIQGGY